MPVVIAMHIEGPGTWHPTAASAGGDVAVAAFSLDETPVTNDQFLTFVTSHPEWQRAKIAPIYADERYLGAWASPTALGASVLANGPVTNVSWFAARAYCEARGAHLPTTAQWEVAASASATAADGRGDLALTQRALDWYAAPNRATLPPVGHSSPNYWGVRDLIGLVWEWTDDFNGEIVDLAKACGGGAVGATDTANYPAVARAELRSSLKAAYTMPNMGFRCAKDVPG